MAGSRGRLLAMVPARKGVGRLGADAGCGRRDFVRAAGAAVAAGLFSGCPIAGPGARRILVGGHPGVYAARLPGNNIAPALAEIFADMKYVKKFDGSREGKPGTEKKPVSVRVQTEERSKEIQKLCTERGWMCTVSVDPESPEDTVALDRLLNPPKPVHAEKRVGRNDPCPCGSGRKYKQCCGK